MEKLIDFGLIERLRISTSEAQSQEEMIAAFEQVCDEVVRAGDELDSDAKTIIWAASRHCDPKGAAIIDARLKGVISLSTARTEPSDGEKKHAPAKRLVYNWSQRIVRHYEFESFSRQSLTHLAQISTDTSWDTFARVANSCMLDRHEKCASQETRKKFIRIGAAPNGGNKRNMAKAPIIPADISAIMIRKTSPDSTDIDARAAKWINPCRVCVAKDWQALKVNDFALNMDKNGILVPSKRTKTSCNHCAAPRSQPQANVGKKRPYPNHDPVEACKKGPLHAARNPQAKEFSDLPSKSAPTSTDAATVSMSNQNRDTVKPLIRRQPDEGNAGSTNAKQASMPNQQPQTKKPPELPHSAPTRGQTTRKEAAPSVCNARNEITCSACCGLCKKCLIPPGYSASQAEEIFQIVHKAATVPVRGDSTSSSLMSRVQFAEMKNITDSSGDFPNTPGVVWRITWQALEERLDVDERRELDRRRQCREDNKSYMHRTSDQDLELPQIFVINEQFPDRYTPEGFADQLDDTFSGGLQVATRIDSHPTPELLALEDLTQTLRAPPEKRDRILNALSLDAITNAVKPGITRIPRLRLLERIVNRVKANRNNGTIEKQMLETPYDVRSCLSFSILGMQGAFSGAHRDSLGGTWLRNLFGKKLWWFVPDCKMTPEDWDRFAEEGNAWDPGNKAQAILLKENDVLVMPRPVIHAVYTVEDCAMEGGMIWDEHILLKLIDELKYTAMHTKTTNEPLALQLPEVVDTLQDVVSTQWEDNSNRQAILQAITQLQKISCSCSLCSDECPCKGRRCTKWCHQDQELLSLHCSAEGWGIVDLQDDDTEDSDFEPGDRR